MKRKLTAAAAAALLTAGMLTLSSCSAVEQFLLGLLSRKPITEENNNMKAESFDSISIGIVADIAATMEYEVLRTDSGAQVSYYIIPWSDEDTPKDEFLQQRAEGGEELYEQLLDLVNECDVKSWDGFSGYDPDVLDGSSATINAVIDGEEISAHGNNSFPEGYSDFVRALRKILDEG